jgi:hypothetical protein
MKAKVNRFTKKLTSTAFFAVLVISIALIAGSITSQAATRKVSAKTKWTTATNLKIGKNKVTAKKNNSYTKFTAPAAGTYTFTISDIVSLKKKNPDYNLGNLYISKLTESGDYIQTVKVKTNGGTSSCLWTATKASYNSFYKNKKIKKVNNYLATRYGSLYLQKGESVWLQYYYTGNSCTYNITVKAKK